MAFGHGWRSRFLSRTPWCVLAALALLAAGCGGGGGDDGNNGGGTPGTATVTGRVVDVLSQEGIAGATITYGTDSDVSGPTGAFALTVPAPSSQRLFISATDYRDSGQYPGGVVRLRTEGIPITVRANQNTDVGTVQLYGPLAPPLPPPLPSF